MSNFIGLKINDTYTIKQHCFFDADVAANASIHLFQVDKTQGRSRDVIEQGLLLVVNEIDLNRIQEILAFWKAWRMISGNQKAIINCSDSGQIKKCHSSSSDTSVTLDGHLFAFLAAQPFDFQKNVPYNKVDVPSIIRSWHQLACSGIICRNLQNWMIARDRECGREKLIPSPYLTHPHPQGSSVNSSELGALLRQRFSNIPSPWNSLIDRLIDQHNPPPIEVLGQEDVWNSAVPVFSDDLDFQLTQMGNTYTVRWLSPFHSSTQLFYLSEEQKRRFSEGMVLLTAELSLVGQPIPLSSNSATLVLQTNEKRYIAAVQISGAFAKIQKTLVLGGLEEVTIRNYYWDRPERQIVLELNWPLNISTILVIIREDRYAQNAKDCQGTNVRAYTRVKATIIQPERFTIPLDRIDQKLYISVFSQAVVNGDTIHSYGQNSTCHVEFSTNLT